MSEAVRLALNELRAKLLDLSGRNRLLNYRHAESARQARFVDTSLDNILAGLDGGQQLDLIPLPELQSQKTPSPALAEALDAQRRVDAAYMRETDEAGDSPPLIAQAEKNLMERFCAANGIPVPGGTGSSAAEVARRNGIKADFELPTESAATASARRRLQTLFFPDVYERRLSKVREDARSSLQELGINTLFVALGFLEWYEADSSSKSMLSPLLLVPVAIEREIQRGHYAYSISGIGDDPETNVTLIERLRRDFALTLPDFDSEKPLKSYFADVEDAIRDNKRWKIRTFATLGTFNFSRLALYKDLDSEARASDQLLEEHKIVSSLLAGSDDGGYAFAPESPPEEAFKIGLSPHIITDADSSQLAAIVEAASGKNLVIEGPPGTGKSQTITNLIAAALGSGKSVLFLAEKSAALNVVKNRLSDAGLGEFCLELHSTKARKAEVHESIRQRLRVLPDRTAEPHAPLSAARLEANKIAEYCEDLHRPTGALQYKLYDLVWRQERLRQEIGDRTARHFDAVSVAAAETVSRSDLNELAELISAWLDRRTGLIAGRVSLEEHPLQVLHNADLDDAAAREFVSALDASLVKADALHTLIQALVDIYPDAQNLTIQQLQQRAAFLIEIREIPTASRQVVRRALPIRDLARVGRQIEEREGIEGRIKSIGSGVITAVRDAYDSVTQLLSSAKGLSEHQFSDHSNVRRKLRECAADEARLTALQSLVTELGELTGEIEPDSSSFFAAVRMFRNIIMGIERDVLHARFPAVLETTNARKIQRVCDEVTELRNRFAEASATFNLGLATDVENLRSAGRSLKSAGALWFLDREVKTARKHFTAVAKTAVKCSNAEMGRQLLDLADLIDVRRNFEVNTENAAVLGPLFRGLETDLDLVHRLVALANALDTELAARGRHGAKLASFARSASVDAVDRLMELSATKSFIDAVAACTEGGDGLKASLQRLQSQTEAVSRLNDHWSSLPTLISQLTIRELHKACNLAMEARAWEQRWEQDHELRGLLPIDDDAKRAEAIAALGYVAALRNAGSQAEIDRLSDIEPILVRENAARSSAALIDAIGDFREALRALECLGGLDQRAFSHLAIPEVRASLAAIRGSSHEIFDWLQYRRFDRELDERGLREFVQRLLDLPGTCTPATVLEYVVIRSAVASAQGGSPALRGASGLALSAARERFAQSDRALLEQQRRALRNVLLKRSVPNGVGTGLRSTWTEGRLVELELGKEKRHIALRDFFNRAGRAVQQLKPCFMMSPLSVSQFVPPGALSFDIVIIDEASQMKPEDALGAISRGRQLIVVGDSKQLPPTAFFDRADQSDVSDEDSVDTESILELASQQFGRPRRLLWHYRSRHPGLIAFSNQQFYESELMLFPAPTTDLAGGVRLHRVDGQYCSRMNFIEAAAVADAAARFMVDHPDMSLAIVTLNQPQRDLIDEEIQARALRDSRIAEYCAKWEASLAPFIIKNLETIQGDERDAVFISTVYGRDESGAMFQRFGPINGKNGWRRLNVLFTRAKHRVDVFTSMHPSDVHADEASSEGVRALKGYLEFALSGTLPSGTPTQREPDSDFEVSVANVLRAHGYKVAPQVGVAGFFIDIGVVDPSNANRYLAGIECDGWAYHSSKSARDRDRLREEVLTRLGWRLIRIWSTDWFTNPGRETNRLISELRGYEGRREVAANPFGAA